MTSLRILLAAALVAFAPAAALAQQPVTEIRPGSPEIDGSRIVPRADTFAVMAVNARDALPTVYVELRTARIDVAGVPAVSRVERMRSLPGVELSVDSFTVAAGTLAPLSVSERSRSAQGSLAFEGLAVTGHRMSRGTMTPVEVRLSAPVFLGNSIDVVLSTLPLAEGRAYRWPILREEDAGLDSVDARVTRRERVRTVQGGTCLAWRVETRAGGEPGVYWMERRTGELIQYEGAGVRFRILSHRACLRGNTAARPPLRADETRARTAA
jgi:hypothetical protein